MTTTSALITEPGVYEIPNAVYHADPVPAGSLSSSGARRLLPPSCPAVFAWEREHPVFKYAFDFGHAAHKLVLGDGPPIVEVDAADWRTKAAREAKEQAHADGKIPLLADDAARVKAMADALHAHPIAGKLLHPGRGLPERSLFWVDEPSGIWRRARLDQLPNPSKSRMIVADYKSTLNAEPGAFAKSVANYGYHCQGAWYLDAVEALGLADDAAFLLVAQEKNPPYLVSVVELSATALRIGAERNRRAIDIYAECATNDNWPGYSEAIELVDLPLWAERQHEQEMQ